MNQERDRFTLLPLTRSFVLDVLAQEPGLELALREQWIAYFTVLARPCADLHLRWHDLPMIRQEGMHYITLASWCQQAGRPDVFLKILPALNFYCDHTGEWANLISTGQLALEYAQLTGDLESIVYIETHVLCHTLCDQGHNEEAERFIIDALKTVQQIDNPSRECEVLMVELVTTTYQTGVKLTKEALEALETHLQRLPSLEKWFVDIPHTG